MNRLCIPGLLLLSLAACSQPGAGAGVHGTLAVRTHDDADGTHRLDQELTLANGDRIALERADWNTALVTASGSKVPLAVGTYQVTAYGERVGRTFVATRVELRETAVGRITQPLLDVFGERKALVLLIGFPGAPNTYDPTEMHEGVFGDGRSADSLYREASRNKMWLGGIRDPEGDVWGPYEAPTDGCSTLSYSEVSDLALDAARDDGIDVNAYQHRIYSFPPVNSCPGGGIGGGNQVWVFGITPQYIWDWVGHEAAHGFGFGHASSYDDCTVAGDPVTIGGACSHNEYGDPTDIMGGRNFQFSTWHMERAGWLEIYNVAVVESSQRVAIAPLEFESDRIQSVRVPRDNGEFFHFEYRQPQGYDEGLESELTDGVLVRLVADPNDRDNPHLLDMRPETSHNRDAALGVGRSFEDGQIHVTVVEANGTEAVIDVTIGDVPPATGGASGAGGAASTGGTSGTGGDPSTGGTDPGTGGAPSTGGTDPGTGGDPSTGGTPGTGGATGGANTGGDAPGTGGVIATGGAPAAGGSAAGGVPPTAGTGGVPATGTGGVSATGLGGGTPGQNAAGGTTDSTTESAGDDSGCGCRTTSSRPSTPLGALLLGLVALLRARRTLRRRARPWASPRDPSPHG